MMINHHLTALCKRYAGCAMSGRSLIVTRNYFEAQPSGLKTRRADAGFCCKASAGRIGRSTRFPPQFGQMPPSFSSAHDLQNVHSNVQINASAASGGRSLSQHSQFGRSSNKIHFPASDKLIVRLGQWPSFSQTRRASPYGQRPSMKLRLLVQFGSDPAFILKQNQPTVIALFGCTP